MEAKRALEQGQDKRFALLIDADNVSAKYIKPILTELSKYGTVTIKRIYGDWTLTLHAKWKDALLENSITPIQQFGYTYGKNATDSAMIIDAMDILYGGGVDGFCIVSSDSDFTRLASRLRESGRTVIGMGEKKTPTPFRRACDIFTVLELLVKNERSEKANAPTMSKEEVERAVVDIIVDNQNNGKATGLGEIGSRLQKRYPDFDVRNYGTNLLSKLLGEFTRVKITKDHSSVAVELTDAGEAERAANGHAEEAKAKIRAEAKDESGEEETAVATEDAEAATPEAEPAKSTRKPRRRKKISAEGSVEEAAIAAPEAEEASETPVEQAPEEATATEEAATSVENAPVEGQPKPKRRPRRRRKAEVEVATVDVDESAAHAAIEVATETSADSPATDEGTPADDQAPEPAEKPKRKPRRRKKALSEAAGETKPGAAIEATTEAESTTETKPEEEAAAEPAPEPESQPSAKPARKPRRRKKAAPAAEAQPESEPEVQPEPAAEVQPKPAAANDPAAFIRATIVAAGADGIALAQLGEDVRGAFKDFKVRDLGFSQLRLYIASIEDFEIFKQGKAVFTRLR